MASDTNLILVINPGSTSTKIAIFKQSEMIFHKNIHHSIVELAPFPTITSQYHFRKDVILNELKNYCEECDFHKIKIIVGRGGLIRPVPSGVIAVNEALIYDLQHNTKGEHASNLGGLIAYDIAQSIPGTKAYIADPVVVDEFEDIARIAGHPLFERKSILHALNQKAVARLHSRVNNLKYEELNLIVTHIGGGVTVGAHRKGRIIDVNQGLDGEGPFSPERSGSLPVGDLVRLCFSGKYPEEQILKMITGKGGLVAYLGTNSAIEVEKMMNEGDEKAGLIYNAMAYQIAKYIGEMAVVLNCEVDGILITGGVAYSDYIVSYITNKVNKLGKVYVYPGEDEMQALAMNGLMILNGDAKLIEYY
ncbi:MAG: butyrate kinase [Bacteroidia bacterium]|nr:butyrate kinase [Bacteroidia bacterium]